MQGRVFAAVAAVCLVGLAAAWASTPSPDQVQRMVVARAAADHVALLRPGQVPPTLAEALIAIEDERFERHHGVDLLGLARALADDVWYRCLCEGGSTLTQQLADVVYYPTTNHLVRKVPSMVVAVRIEARYSKRQILDYYLTVVPTGRGLTGARQAACVYFGRELSQVTLAQAAEIAGMPQAPSAYDPRYEPARAEHRRNVVLTKMVELGYVSDAAARAAMGEPVLASGSGC
jgi:penicillin-binding protein 1A